MERIIELATKRGCEAAEVFFSSVVRTPVEYEFGRLKQIRTVENSVIALRVIKDGKLGFATSTKQGDYETLVEKAVATAQFGTKIEFSFAAPATLPKVNCYDRAVADLTLERMVATGNEIVEAIVAYEPKINAMAQVDKAVAEARALTSLGFDANYRASEYSLMAGGELVEGDNFLMCYDFEEAANLAADARKLVASVLDKFRSARVNRPIASGKFPVILTPLGFEQCLGPLVASINGSAVEKGFSPWKDKIGEPVAASDISIYDDGTYDWGTATAPFDAEGTPRQRTPIIENGVLRNFLLDRRTAHALKRALTGNAVRGGDTPPTIAPTTLVMAAGNAELGAMIKGIDEGVIIDQLMGAWAGNPYSGQINGNIALGYKIERGEITGRVKDCMFSINLFDVLQHQIAAVSFVRQYRGAVLPWVLIDGAGISTKS